jgi:glycosyltransferase involved in cell wall biosynthesis
MPRFTIVVPTRNRPTELGLTTAGLRQIRHPDFSIVVSDNSDDGIAEDNRQTVEKNLDGLNFKYIRPASPMNMVDHWNFAISFAEGEYISIVTDRFTLLPPTLMIIDSVIEQTDTQCVSYLHDTISQRRGHRSIELPNPLSASIILSKEMLDDFASSRFTKRTPRFLNSFCSQEALNNIVQKFGSVFGGIAPDYSFSFRFLSLHSAYINLDAPLLLDHSPASSNGVALTRNQDNSASRDFARRTNVEQKGLLEFGPIPYDQRILPNVILREMAICRSEQHLHNELPMEDPAAFYKACLRHLRRSSRFFDQETLTMEARIEEYRTSHGLSRPNVKFQVDRWLKRARNTVSFHSRDLMRRLSAGRLENVEHTQNEFLMRILAAAAQEVPVQVRGCEQPCGHLDGIQ